MISPRLDHLLRRFIVNFDVTLRGLRKVFFGTIEFTHTSRKVADVLDSEKIHQIKACIEQHIGRRYGLEVSIKEPTELRHDLKYAGVNVNKWQVSVVTAPRSRDIPQQRIKIKIASIPAWTREPRPLQINYDFLPDGYGDILIMTETLNEVMADKLVSLVNTGRYVRHRDIWDLRWLKQKNAEIDIALVNKKLADYQVDHYVDKLDTMQTRLPEVIQGNAFMNEMRRFLPAKVQERTLDKDKFLVFLSNEISEMLRHTKAAVMGNQGHDSFVM